jgi:hypothetical protein
VRVAAWEPDDELAAAGDHAAGHVAERQAEAFASTLVLQVGDVRAGRPIRRDEQLRWEYSWSFVLRPASGGGTRLLVRERTGFGSRFTRRRCHRSESSAS